MSGPNLTSPTEAAKILGITDAMLRQLASDRYYAQWLEAPRNERGHRSYTEQDMEILKFALQTERKGLPHPVIREMLASRGVEHCLREWRGAATQNEMYAVRIERIQNEKAIMARQLDEADRDRQVLRHEILDLKEAIRQKAEQLMAIQVAGFTFNQDAKGRIETMQRNIESLAKDLEEADTSFNRAMDNLQDVRTKLLSLWNRLFRWGELSGQLAEAVVRLEMADTRRRLAREGLATVLSLTNGFLTAKIDEAVQLDAAAGREDEDRPDETTA